MTTDPDRDDDPALTAEYAVGLLSEAETRAFESRLAVDPEFRAMVAVWTEDLVTLTDGIAPVTPPKSVQLAIEQRLFPEARQSWVRRLGLIPSLIGGLVAALLVVWATQQGILGTDPALGPNYRAEIAAQDQSLVVQATYSAASGVIEVDRIAGEQRAGRVLELWLIAGENPPVSLGLLDIGRRTSLVVPAALMASLDGGVLAISDEPPGGSPAGAPTGDVLAVGPLTAL
jgi:anti-sigma-K factor RskA